jgi:sulfite exporter TauE/SafE
MPCALVYAFLVEAAARGGFLDGILIMSWLELGTIPSLLALALGKSILPPSLRVTLTRWSGAFLILLGLWSCYRGWAAPPCCSGGKVPANASHEQPVTSI